MVYNVVRNCFHRKQRDQHQNWSQKNKKTKVSQKLNSHATCEFYTETDTPTVDTQSFLSNWGISLVAIPSSLTNIIIELNNQQTKIKKPLVVLKNTRKQNKQKQHKTKKCPVIIRVSCVWYITWSETVSIASKGTNIKTDHKKEKDKNKYHENLIPMQHASFTLKLIPQPSTNSQLHWDWYPNLRPTPSCFRCIASVKRNV